MNADSTTLEDIAALSALANGIIPPDTRDAGAAAVQAGLGLAERVRHGPARAVYVEGMTEADKMSRKKFGCPVHLLEAREIHELLGLLAESSPAFFRQLRADVCALYLSDPGVWQRIGFPGPSAETGGYPRV